MHEGVKLGTGPGMGQGPKADLGLAHPRLPAHHQGAEARVVEAAIDIGHLLAQQPEAWQTGRGAWGRAERRAIESLSVVGTEHATGGGGGGGVKEGGAGGNGV